MKKYLKFVALAVVAFAISACGESSAESAKSAESSIKPLASINRPECIAPAAPGGGFDLTCKLAQVSLLDTKLLSKPMRVTFMPGGLGAVAMNSIIANRAKDANAIVAFSSGTLLNITQGKHGKYNENDVRWLASAGVDYGCVAVKADSPYKNLKDLVDALKKNPKSVTFGAGAAVGGQDWLQTAMVAKLANLDSKQMRYVAFEGGGEVLSALLGGHIQVLSGATGEITPYVESRSVRILAVFADKRLDGELWSDIPTAKEQGYDVKWEIVRGYYLAPQVSDEEYNWWVEIFEKLYQSDEFKAQRAQRGLFEFNKSGAEFDAFVKEQTASFVKYNKEFNIK